MAETDYHKGTMDTSDQKVMWGAFMDSASWGALILIMIVGYLTFTLAIGLNWILALAINTVAGLAIGLFMGFGSAWIVTIFGLLALGVVVQGFITLAGFFI